jgi:hypothetical protein
MAWKITGTFKPEAVGLPWSKTLLIPMRLEERSGGCQFARVGKVAAVGGHDLASHGAQGARGSADDTNPMSSCNNYFCSFLFAYLVELCEG